MFEKKIIECETLPMDIENGVEYLILQQKPNTYTHGYFKYPCKFIPEIPRWFLKRYIKENEKILDPFAGSGTTLLEASIHNIKSVGIEISPLAELLITVKTTKLTKNERDSILHFVEHIDMNIHYTYPKIDNIHHWFDDDNLIKLSCIKQNIELLPKSTIKKFLQICFVSSIRKCSKADTVSPKPYVSTRIKKEKCNPEIAFKKIVELYLSNNVEMNTIEYTNDLAQILKGDATNFRFHAEFDGAITSPPYINAFDYVRILRLETLWLNLSDEDELRKLKKHYVGTENVNIKEFDEYQILENSGLLKEYYEKIRRIDEKRAHIVLKFFYDMKKNLMNVHKALKKNTVYVVVIGNSRIRDIEVESWKVLSQIAAFCGFTQELYFSYQIRNHYLRIDRKKKGGKVHSDFVVVFRK